MFKLLKVELKTLFKWRAIAYLIATMIVLGVFMIFINTTNDDPTLGGIFEFNYIMLMISSVVLGLFVYRDYSQNTIRNKIIVGHSRVVVYFSKVITIFIAMIVIAFVFGASGILTGLIIGDLEYIKWDIFIQNYLMVITTLAVVTSVISLLSINIQSPVGAVLPMMLMYSIMFISMIYMEILAINENTEVLELFQTLPITSMLALNETTKPVNLPGTIAFGGMISAILLCVGCCWFRRLDLK